MSNKDKTRDLIMAIWEEFEGGKVDINTVSLEKAYDFYKYLADERNMRGILVDLDVYSGTTLLDYLIDYQKPIYKFKFSYDDIYMPIDLLDLTGTLVCKSYTNFELGHMEIQFSDKYNSLNEWFEEEVSSINPDTVYLPLYVHRNMTFWLETIPYPRDSTHVGFIYVDRNDPKVAGLAEEQIKERLIQDVKDYNKTLAGRVLAFDVLDEDGDFVNGFSRIVTNDYEEIKEMVVDFASEILYLNREEAEKLLKESNLDEYIGTNDDNDWESDNRVDYDDNWVSERNETIEEVSDLKELINLHKTHEGIPIMELYYSLLPAILQEDEFKEVFEDKKLLKDFLKYAEEDVSSMETWEFYNYFKDMLSEVLYSFKEDNKMNTSEVKLTWD